MNTTSESLLHRLSDLEGQAIDQAAWADFVRVYTPLIFRWSRKIGLDTNDSSDLAQDVLAIVFQKLPNFRYEADKSFRSWLKTVTLNRYREIIRRKSAQQIVASHSVLEQFQPVQEAESTWDIDYARLLISSAMESMKSDFAPETWKALKMIMSQQASVDEAAQQTGVSPWTIYSARSRLMKRLRNELDGML